MQFLEHELAVEGREQQRKATGSEAPAAPAADVSQITRLEHRINALEAMVNGLTDEVLDLKTITRKLSDLLEKLGGAAPVPPAPPRAGIRRPAVESAKDDVPSPSVGRIGLQAQLPTQGTEKRTISAPVPQRAAPQQPMQEQRPAAAAQPVAPAPAPVADSVLPEGEGSGQFEYVMQPDGTILKRQKTKGVKNVIIAGTGFGKGSVSRSSAIRAESSAVIEADEVKETVEL
ncbi:MAG TPA: hypothetical protein O0X27_02410 [Methanocorpusculum sp.]|nr:hypothetical protein [Methanocorpusculum sp.]